MDVHEAAAQLNALVQYLRNEEAVSVASRNRLAGFGKSVRSFADLFPKGNRRHVAAGADGSGGDGDGDKQPAGGREGGRGKNVTRDGRPRKEGAEGGGGSEQEERRATAAECTINIKSGRPFTGTLYEIKDVLKHAAIEGGFV